MAMPSISVMDDVTLVRGAGEQLVVACDSCAGAGDKPHDHVHVTPYTVGRFTCRVPLLEVLALGAQPFLVVSAIGVEPEPTGAEILRGIRDEMRTAGVPDGSVLISTEKNMPVSQTAAGVTVLAGLPRGFMRYGLGRAGDMVAAVGLPKVGAEVCLDDPEIADIPTLQLALAFPFLREALPVGSAGIAREADLSGPTPSTHDWPAEPRGR